MDYGAMYHLYVNASMLSYITNAILLNPNPHCTLSLNHILITPQINKKSIYVCFLLRITNVLVILKNFRFYMKDYRTRQTLLLYYITCDIFLITKSTPQALSISLHQFDISILSLQSSNFSTFNS